MFRCDDDVDDDDDDKEEEEEEEETSNDGCFPMCQEGKENGAQSQMSSRKWKEREN